jgi:large subunit ribosomal protein L15
MLQLNNLCSLVKKRKRVGRGGSRGGTSGKGHKGQKARSGGYVRPGFEGGQMPLFRRLPRRGFNNTLFKQRYHIVTLNDLEQHFAAGEQVDPQSLIAKGVIKVKSSHGQQHKIKILADGQLTKKLVINAHAFSASAAELIQKSGGETRLIKEG